MRLVKNLNPNAYRPPSHIAADDGSSLCGRLVAGPMADVYSSAHEVATCTWCLRRAEDLKASEHSAKMVCGKCGSDWPCTEWAQSQDDRCKGVTAAGKPCTKFGRYGGYCRTHDV